MTCRNQPTLHAYTKGTKTIGAPRFKKVTKYRLEGTGTYHPDQWKISYDNRTVNDVTEDFILQEFGAEYTSFVKMLKFLSLFQGHNLPIKFCIFINGCNYLR